MAYRVNMAEMVVLPTPPFMDVTVRIWRAFPFESGIGCGSEPSGDRQQTIGRTGEFNRTLAFGEGRWRYVSVIWRILLRAVPRW
jgi:hypothetical protein